MRIGVKASAIDLVQVGMAPSHFLGSELHRDVSRVLLSVAVGL